jgi:FlaA1/EpsC-like NDP-sugar epimerase
MSKYPGKRIIVVLHDLTVVALAWFGAYWLRFNMQAIPEPYLSSAVTLSAVVLPVQAIAFAFYGLHRGEWRFASMPDLVRIAKSTATGTVLILSVIFLFSRLQHVPRTVLPLYAVLLCVGLGTTRFLYRWIRDRHLYVKSGTRALVVGAGRAGEMLVRDMLRDPARAVQPIAFVDDKRSMLGREVHGVRVLGSTGQIAKIVDERDIELILLALPSASAADMQRIVEECEKVGIPFRTLPRMEDLVAGRISTDTLREVSIEDLLGREPVTLDRVAVEKCFSRKCVMVTGSGGSIGAELCRQLAKTGPESLVLFEQSEFQLFEIERKLRLEFPDLTLHVHLGDVTDEAVVEKTMEQHHPHVVFHAAAYKHVPMLEHQARQAARNNVLGSRIVAAAADRVGVDAFVLISTDKAVNPANIMGASKRIAEIFCQNFDRLSRTRFITVRFGNVLGSAGSVVPLFREQIQAGGPVTVTHADIERFFMTIPEACQLILQAGTMGRGGEIYVLDMGAPVKITYLAEQMIRLAGLEPGKDIEIVYTGLRPGEKLYEELFHDKELSGTTHEKIFQAQSREVDWSYLKDRLMQLEQACGSYDETEIRALMCELVPEIQPSANLRESNIVPFEVKSGS